MNPPQPEVEAPEPAQPTPRTDDGSLVATCRNQAGLTREQLGARLDVPEHIVALWESPDYEGVDLPMLRRVAAATGRELEIRFTRSQRGLKPAIGRIIAAASLVACFATLPACITETTSAVRTPSKGAMSTQGVIVRGDIENIWNEVQTTVASMTSEPLYNRGVEKSFSTTVNGEDLSVLVEPYDSQRTIVHVNSTNADIARYIRERVTLR
jgi:transcriptional regulator with XRE-family HTH domain